ncbi:MAG: hypothetical protein ING41_15515 [Burkholderiales bacterium]|nr:hypothetical protein [Burkholderiales bacterium]
MSATGTGTLSYLWQRDGVDTPVDGFVDLSGSNFPARRIDSASLLEGGARFRVKVSDSVGSTTSGEAVLTVVPKSGVSYPRAWSAGQLLPRFDGFLSRFPRGAMADDGSATVLLLRLKADCSDRKLFAVRATIGASGPHQFGTPRQIDLQADGTALPLPPCVQDDTSVSTFFIWSAPNGNAVAFWNTMAPCTAQTYQTSGDCRYLAVARYLAATDTWEPAQRLVDIPNRNFSGRINDKGDVLLAYTGWERIGSTVTHSPALAWRAAGASTFTVQRFGGLNADRYNHGLDANGRLLLVGEAARNGGVSLVSHEGSIGGGFGAEQTVASGPANTANGLTLGRMVLGRNGRALMVWQQGVGTQAQQVGSARDLGGGAWASPQVLPTSTFAFVTVADNGSGLLLDLNNCQAVDFGTNGWASSVIALTPARTPCFSGGIQVTRDGSFLSVGSQTIWSVYDGVARAYIKPAGGPLAPADLLFGTVIQSGLFAPNPVLYSQSSVGLVLSESPWSTLPTPSAPDGVRSTEDNIWGWTLR